MVWKRLSLTLHSVWSLWKLGENANLDWGWPRVNVSQTAVYKSIHPSSYDTSCGLLCVVPKSLDQLLHLHNIKLLLYLVSSFTLFAHYYCPLSWIDRFNQLMLSFQCLPSLHWAKYFRKFLSLGGMTGNKVSLSLWDGTQNTRIHIQRNQRCPFAFWASNYTFYLLALNHFLKNPNTCDNESLQLYKLFSGPFGRF